MRRPIRPLLAVITSLTLVATGASCGRSTPEPQQPSGSGEQVATAASAGVQKATADAAARPVVLAAVGDISPRRMGRQRQTADLALSWKPTAALVLGDQQYPDGKLADFRKYYDPAWGRLKSKTWPVPGNHEYKQPDARGYFSYFGKRAKPQGRSYYSFNLSGWHLVALNSEISHGAKSAQLRWLRADLKKNKKRCVLAYWHKPRFSSGAKHGSNKDMDPFWDALYAERADVVLNGHEHNYERFARQASSSRRTNGGIRQFVVGTGGAAQYPFGKRVKNSQVRLSKYYGVLQLTLTPTRYKWKFVSIDKKTRDSGSNGCH